MVGDLNLKKSWNPKLLKNQEKVWKREQHALEEHQKIQQRLEEIGKEREESAPLSSQHPAQPKKSSRLEMRIDWMYNEQSFKTDDYSHNGINNSVEKQNAQDDKEFLLGKRRKGRGVQRSQNTKRQLTAKQDGEIKIHSEVDVCENIVSKIIDRNDPLLKLQEATHKRQADRSNDSES
ncbi:BA75_04423T0 [Komagataella pastoris]|uniref:Pre-mRNA-splicing factor CWC25 n=1 Tax=Komagataella pastoris TaxID=4922 RepID=A0A1B2JHG4_PICPA|nr:BA75_04359T0 [Komagataella pastoris]ANZ77787.1 BA75_04423T0 [Komagataella pastoris]